MFWNSSDYPDYPAASHADGGIVVLATLAALSDEPCQQLKPFFDCLSSIEYKGESRDIPNQVLDLQSFLPGNVLNTLIMADTPS